LLQGDESLNLEGVSKYMVTRLRVVATGVDVELVISKF
jgi:hypothetical protein